jgi:Fe-S-cluster containining protein
MPAVRPVLREVGMGPVRHHRGILPWIVNNRWDILQHVSLQFTDGRWCNGRDISMEEMSRIARIYYWTTPDGRVLRHCPFLQRGQDGWVFCMIHSDKPAVCRNFTPWNEGIRDYALNCPACKDTAP